MAMSLASCKSFGSDYDLVMEGWEAKENGDGIVYFVNNQRKATSWIHPCLNKVLEDLGNYNDIKYAAYRTALKLRFLQKKLGLSWISIMGIKKVFSSKDFSDDCSNSEETLSCREIFSVVHNIVETSDSLRIHRNQLVQASEMILNFMLELFDTSRTGKVAKRSLRVALVALCSAKLSDKYRFFFDEISNDQGLIERGKFLYLIYDLMQITDLLKESTAFGTNVSAAVNSCLKSSDESSNSRNNSSDENSQDLFYSWLLQEPISIIWLPTLHRVIATENISHNVQCSVCSTQPIVGLRYRCMQCFHYDLCQSCFFQGLFSRGHRLKHPMQEYCFPSTKKDNTKALLKIVRNKISKRHRRSKIKFLPVDDDSITGSVFQWQPRSLIPDPRGSFHSSIDSGLAVGSSSDNGGEYHLLGSDDDLVMVKKWCKPLEVLGEPWDSSSPYVQQETNLSKKKMEHQELSMAQTILQLQEENRLLRRKLSAARKRELEGEREDDDYNQSPELLPPPIRLDENTQTADLLEEITTDSPISPIKSVRKSDGQTKTVDASFLMDREFELDRNQREISVNVLEIVGSHTPIPSSFCLEKCKDKISLTSRAESGISEYDAEFISAPSTEKSLRKVKAQNLSAAMPMQSEDDSLATAENDGEHLKNPVVSALKTCSDTDTESTSLNDLEYTYSDMSLSVKSEATSRASQSLRSEVLCFKPAQLQNADQKEVMEDVGNSDSGQISGHDDVDNNANDGGSSNLMTPNMTENKTFETDAMKLCKMKFNRVENLSTKIDQNQWHGVHGSHPHLIYSSTTPQRKQDDTAPQNKTDDDCDFSCDSFRAHKIVIGSDNVKRDMPSQFHSTNYHSGFDLSEIPRQETTASFSPYIPKTPADWPSQLPDTATSIRRKTIEPVFMSTPVVDQIDYGPRKSTLRKKIASKKQREKENRPPSSASSRSSKNSSVMTSKSQNCLSMKEQSHFQATPKSSIPPSQRQSILLSLNQLELNRSYSCNDLSLGKDVGMTTLFDNAEHHRTVGAGSQSLLLEDKEELERLMDRVRAGDSDTDIPPCVDVSDSSMLQAVMNVGDAMADFVQATAEVQLKAKESTHL